MIDLVENLMKFIYTHTLFRNVCYFIFMSSLLLFGFVSFLFFSNGLNFSNIFNAQAYYFLMQKYKNIIITFFIVEQIALVYLILWQDKKLRDINKSPKEQIHIKDIAEIWTQFNAPNEKPFMEKTIYDDRQNIANINETLLSVANYTLSETQIFVNEIVKPISKKISSGHLKTIIKLLNLLEQNKHCPSVVNFAKTEPNVLYQDKEIVTLDKKTKYDIYEKISVYRHSLNVARNAVFVMQKEKGSKIQLIGKLVIVALAHDIGKIERYEIREQKRHISFEERKKMPHQNISSMILYDGFKDCPDLQEIAGIVQRHHDGYVDKNDILLKILIEADSLTRSNELHKYKLGEDICDLLDKNQNLQKETKTPQKATQEQIQEKTTQATTQTQAQPKESTLFLDSFDEFKQLSPHDIQGLVLINVGLGKDLTQDDYKTLNTLLKKELDNEHNTCYTSDKSFYIVQIETDRVKVFNFTYDLSQRIIKSDFKKCFIGFAMAKEAQLGKDMVEKANLALDESIKTGAIVDFKDIKSQNNEDKVVISDTAQVSQTKEETQKQEIKEISTKKDELISAQIPQNKVEATKVVEKSDEISQDDLMSEDIDGAIDEKDDDAFNQIKKITQQIKVINPDSEESFDIVRLESRIFKELATKINTFSSEGGFYINSVSFKKFVLFTKRCLIDTLAKILQNDENIEKKVNFFIRYYRNNEDESKRYIWFVGVEKGYYESMYYIGQNENDFVKTSFVPFEAKLTFNLDVYQLEKMKQNSELASYKIGEFSKERKK